jgi:hypothetical protein
VEGVNFINGIHALLLLSLFLVGCNSGSDGG